MSKTPSKPQAPELTEDRHPSPDDQRWEAEILQPAIEKSPERPIGAATGTNLDANGQARFTTISGTPIRRLYTEADLPEDLDPSLPGEPPYTRGIHASGYRGKLWTMRQFSGFASP